MDKEAKKTEFTQKKLNLGSNGSNSDLEKKNYPVLTKNQAKNPAKPQKSNNWNFQTPKLNYADILYNSGANVRQTKTSTAKLITHQTLPHNPSLNLTTNRASTHIRKSSSNLAGTSKPENQNTTGNLNYGFMRKNNSIADTNLATPNPNPKLTLLKKINNLESHLA